MKAKGMLSIVALTTLVVLCGGCSGDGDVTGVGSAAPATESKIPTAEAIEEPSAEASATPAGAEGEFCIDQSSGTSLDYARALAIAQNSECASEGQLLANHFCNENSGTWWIDIAADKAGCNPACVVNVNTGAAEINWRCTGAAPPTTEVESSVDSVAPDEELAPSLFDYRGWGTYVSEEHGYQVKYPPGVTPTWDEEAKAVTFEGPLEDDEHWPVFFIGHGTTSFYRPDEGVKVREWVESHTGRPDYSEDTEISGLEAYHLTLARSPQSYASDQYYFINDGQMFSITILHTGDKQDWRMYDQFLRSFTFVEPVVSASGSATVESWTGIIGVNPVGRQSRYFLLGQDGRRWFLGTTDEAIWPIMAEAAWKGTEVRIEGVATPMASLLDVQSVAIVGEPAVEAQNLSYFARPSASSALPSDGLGSYHEWSVIDGRLESPWCEGADGSGVGEWILLEFDAPIEVIQINVANGFDYNEEIFEKNNRVKKATFVFSNGERIEWVFEDHVRGSQSVLLARAPGPNIMTNSVKVLIEEVYAGTIYDDTCIAELQIWGHPQ